MSYKYLEMYLKADPISYYSKENNQIQMSIGSRDRGNFFINKETRRNPRKTFDVDNFEKENSMLINCFEHLD